jgi:hypothetical protein
MTRKRSPESELVVSPGSAAIPSRRKSGSRARAKHVTAVEPATQDTQAAEPTAAETQVTVVSVAVTESVYEPRHEEIALQAYLYWEERGRQGGCPEEDWIRAEQALRHRARAVAAA